MKNTKYKIALMSITLLSGLIAYGSEMDKKMMAMDTPEMRVKMADMHQKMADCLRSDKPMGTCKDEMMKSCHETMGKDGCSMMKDMHKNMKGM